MSDTWEVVSAQEEDAWTHDYVKEILDSPCAIGSSYKFGTATAHWQEIDPNVAIVYSDGDSIDDRYLAEQILVSKLKERGIERAEFSFDPEHKTSDWNDIMDKAQRLIQSGNVTILRNGYNNIVAHVVGDHGEYQTEIGRDDPNSRAITTWQCDCPWDQFAWGRTRKWKKYEGRPCSHVLATFWLSQSTPLDSDAQGENVPPGQKPPMPGGGEQMQIPFQEQGPVTPPPQPAQPGVLPPFPGEQMQLLPPGQLQPGQPGISVSMPGARQPTPFNPVQNPSTYSKVASDFNNGDMVRLEEEEYGVLEGKSEEHGAGGYKLIPKGSIGEVMGEDPTLGWVDCIFVGPQKDAGPLEPYHVRAWVDKSKLTPMPGIQPPGPAVRRRT